MLLNCNYCGGELEISGNETVTTCKYCRTAQTLPITKNDGAQNLFNRASALRRRCDFDKAEALYEKILETEANEAEAYWGLVLCKYGIEYVEDPQSGKMMPTCHRASYDSVVADGDYRSAIENADAERKALYQKQAREIDKIQKDILSLAQKEESYDIFICYKETDESGKRTRDSSLANDIYYQLTDEGYKVFYAAITLEGKLGAAYEPIIFSALNSAKVMLVIGTKPEYFNAVWVKNEWSRYLKIIKKDRNKLLIPCYRDMDAYDLPDEFAHLQAQNMDKIGFITDLIRGIKKVMERFEPKKPTVIKETVRETVKETVVKEPTVVRETVIREPSGGGAVNIPSASGAGTAPLLKRAFMFLEDGDFKSADEYCERVLDADPENAEAYLGKLMAELEVTKREALKDCKEPFDGKDNCKKALRFASAALEKEIKGYVKHISDRNRAEHLEGTYAQAKKAMAEARLASQYKNAADIFRSIRQYKDSAELISECNERAKAAGLEEKYQLAVRTMQNASTEEKYKTAASFFTEIKDYKDSEALIAECRKMANKAKREAESERKRKEIFEAAVAREQAEALERQRAEEKRKERYKLFCVLFLIGTVVAVIAIIISANVSSLKKNNGLKFKLNDDGESYMVKKISSSYKSKTETLVIPDTYNGKPVTVINERVFWYMDSLKSITIPESITDIGDCAFAYCNNVTELNFNAISCNDLSEIAGAFLNLGTKGDGVTVTVGANVKRIPANLFYYGGNSALPISVNIKKLTIGGSVEEIGASAFRNLNSIASVTVPESVTKLGAYAFSGCRGLTEIYFNAINCADPDGMIDRWHPFSAAGADGNGAKLIFGDSVKRVPYGLLYVHDSSECEINITEIEFGKGVEEIGGRAFEYNINLKSITLPKALTKIGYSAFWYCQSLEAINYRGTEEEWNTVEKDDHAFHGISEECKRNYGYAG